MCGLGGTNGGAKQEGLHAASAETAARRWPHLRSILFQLAHDAIQLALKALPLQLLRAEPALLAPADLQPPPPAALQAPGPVAVAPAAAAAEAPVKALGAAQRSRLRVTLPSPAALIVVFPAQLPALPCTAKAASKQVRPLPG